MRVAALENEPEVLPHAQIFWRAFTVLNDRRMYDQGSPQPIQISEMVAYMTTQALADDVEFLADTTHYVMLLDRRFMEHARKEAERKQRVARQRQRK